MCPGFEAAGITAGLKKKNKKDLGLIYSKVPANVAGVFTRNRVKAAPVMLDKERIKSGICRAIIVNRDYVMPKPWHVYPHMNSGFQKIWYLWHQPV